MIPRKLNYYFGCIVGRVTNRIANGTFKLNGKEYNICKSGKHAEHGGLKGFCGVPWEIAGSGIDGDNNVFVEFQYKSKDGEEGFPGNLEVIFRYTLNNNNELKMTYKAKTDADTVVNLTNHAYFNLLGVEESHSIMDHYISIVADEYIDVDNELIPTGEIKSVTNTPMDLRKSTKINTFIPSDFDQVVIGNQGYDSSWVGQKPDPEKKEEKLIATAYEEKSGRVLEVLTTYPTVQFYTGNFLDGVAGKNHTSYLKQTGFCLETQFHTNAPNISSFPSILLRPAETYNESTTYRFSCK